MKSEFSVVSFVSGAAVFAGVLLTGCGGGGNSSTSVAQPAPPAPQPIYKPEPDPTPVPPSITTRTISGTISVAENSAVDSDTNNSEQANRASNNDPSSAQKLSALFALVGSVNMPGAGPQGPNFKEGDQYDYYSVSLQANQVVELEFTADAQANDIDLVVIDDTATLGGSSEGPSNPYECVRATKTGTYFVVVGAYKGASIYNMRVSAPNPNTSCPNTTAPLNNAVRGQLLTKRVAKLEGLAVQTQRKAQSTGDVQMKNALMSSEFPVLWRLPSATNERVAAMAHASSLSGQANAPKKSAALAQPEKETDPVTAAIQDAFDTAAYTKQLMATGLFEYVEPNRLLSTQAGAPVGNYPPNDRLYTNQRWHYEMIGMPAAMERLVALSPQPTHRPLVAVIDSGIVADHPDLAPQIEHQASFTNGGTFSNNANDIADKIVLGVFHGSHVAGTVAAATFDGIGAAGVAPMAKLMPINIFEGELATTFDTVQAILYAAGLPNSSGKTPPRRADVINLSLSNKQPVPCSASEADAIKRARAAGVLVVAASGNKAASKVNAPGNCPGVISVGAVGATRQKAGYSNMGEGLMVTAPGGDGATTVFSTVAGFNAAGLREPDYGYMGGTSMASPHVAGVMALMRFVNPGITPDQVAAAFTAGQLTDELGSPGYDTTYGWGLINARKAVDVALALKGDGSSPTPGPQGTVVAQPSSLDMGALQTSAELTLALSAASNEKVTSVVSDSSAVSVTPKQVDPATKLGTYTITVNRASLAAGASFVNLQVTTSAARKFNVQVSVQKQEVGATQPTASVGTVYVLVLDAETSEKVAEVPVLPTNGRYAWTYTGSLPQAIQVLAGTDVNNDNLLCSRGEACGAFPTHGARLPVIYLDGNRNDMNFSLATFGGFTVNAAADSATTPWQEFERMLTGATP